MVELRQGNHVGEPTCQWLPMGEGPEPPCPRAAPVRCPTLGAGGMSSTKPASLQSYLLQITLRLDQGCSAGDVFGGSDGRDCPRLSLS